MTDFACKIFRTGVVKGKAEHPKENITVTKKVGTIDKLQKR